MPVLNPEDDVVIDNKAKKNVDLSWVTPEALAEGKLYYAAALLESLFKLLKVSSEAHSDFP